MLPGPVPKRKGYHGQIQPFLSRSSPGLVLPLDPASTWCLCPWSIGSGPVHVDLVHLSHCHTESDGVFGVLVAGADFFPRSSSLHFACLLVRPAVLQVLCLPRLLFITRWDFFFVIKKIIWDFGLNSMLLMPMLTALLPPPCFTHTVFGLGVIL